MIKKMRRNFILIVFGILLVVFIGVTSSVYVITNRREASEVNRILMQMATNPAPPPGLPDNSVRISKGILIVYNTNTSEQTIFYDVNYYTVDQVNSIIDQINQINRSNGRVDAIFFNVFTFENRIILAAVDRSVEIALNQNNLLMLSIVEVISLIILMATASLLSRYTTKPLVISIKRQQEFISDASHELKTPLAIISSNAEVLNSDYGDSKWTKNILSQVEYMNHLVNQLLNLASLDEGSKVIKIEEINLSELLETKLLSFETNAYENKKAFSAKIEKNIIINTNLAYLVQLINIFLDNAIKHSAENGQIVVELKNEKRIVISFYNSGCKISPEMKDKIFERFIRVDESRTNSGYGLGLAIAKSICEKLGFELSLDCKEDEYTKFIVKI